MSKTKKPFHDQIDSLCQLLGITKKKYDDKTTISELETIIDELESQIPDDDSINESSSEMEIKISVTDQVPDGVEIQESVDNVEVNSDENGYLEIEATSTFRCQMDGIRMTVLRGKREFLPQSIAMDAVDSGVAVLVATKK